MAILFFSIVPKTTNVVEDVKILLPVKYPLITFSGFREVENSSADQMSGGGHLVFLINTQKYKLGKGN